MLDLATVPSSPFRRCDPRVKLAICLASCCLAVAFDAPGIYILIAALVLGLVWGRVVKPSVRLLRRLAIPVVMLFVIDTWLVDVQTACEITARIMLGAFSFCLMLFTTTPDELALALRKCGMSARHAHCAVLLFEQMPLIMQELSHIREAYRQRHRPPADSASTADRLIAIVRMARHIMLPAVILATHRAWACAEASYARGCDALKPSAFKDCSVTWGDAVLLLFATAGVYLAWRWR